MIKRIIYLLLLGVLLNSCSTTKYIPANEKLYTGGEVKVADKNIAKGDASNIKSEMKALIRPVPNSKLLGMRIKLWLYYKTKNRSNFIQKFLSKYGQPPVFVSQVNLEKNSEIMQNRLQNESYFQSTVKGDTVGKERTAKAVFTVNAGPSYTINKVSFPSATDNSLDTAVRGTMKETLLKPGEKYNLDVIKSERIRIDSRLKEEGFFYFSPEHLIIRVDSTVSDHKVDLVVRIKPETPDQARWIYTIRNLYVYPNYSLRDTSLKLDQAVPYRWYNIVDPRKTARPYLFANTVLLRPNDTYSRTTHNNSLNRFINLGPYRYVKNRFEDVTPDSPKLDVYYFLTPYKRKSLQLDLLGRTSSANYTGSQINLSWRNRNAFKGGELLTVSLFGSTDVQAGGQNGGFNVFQYGAQTSLSWPRLISPFNFRSDNAYIPRTTLTLNYTSVVRQKLYSLNSFSGSFGYQFKPNLHKLNELNILEVNYVKPRSVSQLYTDSIAKSNNPALKHVIDPQFTVGVSYAYTFDNTTEDYRTNSLYYRGKLSLSNNLLGIISGADTLGGKVKTLFGTPFNQYVKLENEVRFFHKITTGTKLATRFLVGVGLPYGNSTVLPYSQQFFIGGPNSLRGFRARSIGPGTVNSTALNGGFVADQSGDIKVEANVEYRAKLFSIVYGALFADAGNIWNYNTRTGGDAFTKDFYKQFAVDAGFGLRFDATVLVLRTDLGFPLLRPFPNAAGSRSVPLSFNNAIFNLAIGYPF
ncbi:BamA/TamA family outer membrane protein [Mucilaginibacter pallidiroseus]|uniref:BamA/TamA family outer membrane protein n=1 Tax=Mucilaginibacter pallidiroseus TaxID=2599295 RepID=A0A563UD57_9SPHI|nr:BamA/TamA family outer membrane protein [Mucilaginibacter pallidiroseus]TWR29256.1 BamA/TamA family outer membrane protein [Mucilaginibacter pallidiroseus]